jgi:carbon starvation protein
MGKERFLWVTAVPMLFVGAITLTGSYQLFVQFIRRAGSASESAQLIALYLDAALVGVVAVLAAVVLVDSARQWYGYLVQGWPFTSSEVVISEAAWVGRTSPSGSSGVSLPTGRCC